MITIEIPEAWRSRALVIEDADPPQEWFTGEELRELRQFTREQRRREWMATRAAAKHLAVARALCSRPGDCSVARPRLIVRGGMTDAFVSLSHSRGFAAAAIDRRPVGIDIEVAREIRESAAHLFLTDEEAGAMRACRIANRLLHFWAAKEAAWKQRLGAVPTLRQVPIRLVDEREHGLLFDTVETFTRDPLVMALTR